METICGISTEILTIGIGGVNAVIYFGLFILKLAQSIAQMIELGQKDDIIIYILVDDMVNTEILIGCAFSVALIVGTRLKVPGLLLSWMMNQVVFLMSSFLTIIYFLAAPFLKIQIHTLLIELAINGILICFLYIVFNHFQKMRKGNLSNEED